MIGVLCKAVNGLQVSHIIFCAVVTEDTISPRINRAVVSCPGPWREHTAQGKYQACSNTAKHSGASCSSEGRNHTVTTAVQPTANTYHDRFADQFTEGKISKREEEMHSYIHALLQML